MMLNQPSSTSLFTPVDYKAPGIDIIFTDKGNTFQTEIGTVTLIPQQTNIGVNLTITLGEHGSFTRTVRAEDTGRFMLQVYLMVTAIKEASTFSFESTQRAIYNVVLHAHESTKKKKKIAKEG